jgi:hypothetical protein
VSSRPWWLAQLWVGLTLLAGAVLYYGLTAAAALLTVELAAIALLVVFSLVTGFELLGTIAFFGSLLLWMIVLLLAPAILIVELIPSRVRRSAPTE